jgi:hypothetical protein
MGGEWQEFRDCRLVIKDEAGHPGYVLPKGKRTQGYLISDRRVLARKTIPNEETT